MNRAKGVLTIAHSRPKYLEQAVSLARSIRLRTPDVPLAVATDFDPAAFQGLFDHVISWDFSRWPGMLCKLDAYAMTPFDTTLFVETDCLAVRPIDLAFDYFEGQEFAVFGTNEFTTTFFRSPGRIQAAVPSPTYPVFNSGLFYFTKSPQAEEIFGNAKALFRLYDDLDLARVKHSTGYGNAIESDEPLISLAMAKAGLKATDDPRLHVMCAPQRKIFQVEIDVLAGECSFARDGRVVRPVIAHFVGARDSDYAYLRETLRLEAAFRARGFRRWHDSVARARAVAGFVLSRLRARHGRSRARLFR